MIWKDLLRLTISLTLRSCDGKNQLARRFVKDKPIDHAHVFARSRCTGWFYHSPDITKDISTRSSRHSLCNKHLMVKSRIAFRGARLCFTNYEAGHGIGVRLVSLGNSITELARYTGLSLASTEAYESFHCADV